MLTYLTFAVSFASLMCGMLIGNLALNRMVEVLNGTRSALTSSPVGWHAFKIQRIVSSYKQIEPNGKHAALLDTAFVLLTFGFFGTALTLFALPTGSR